MFNSIIQRWFEVLWEDAIHGITLANIESLEYYQHRKANTGSTEKEVCLFVSKGIQGLPWFYQFPLKVFANLISIICLVSSHHLLCSLRPDQRERFLRWFQRIPLFGMFNKLVRTIAFLTLFDRLPLLLGEE